ncbi:MAG: hypothetical protein QMD22_00200 [archaeon]|nr:hypothetical protein [archaeon]
MRSFYFKKKLKILALACALLMLISCAIPSLAVDKDSENGSISGVPLSSNTYYVPDDYAKIQWAVDNASAGDTIIVRDGTYTENVDINKPYLTIQSENGAEVTTVQAANPNDHVFEVTVDYAVIKGLTIFGGTGISKAGVHLGSDANYSTIVDNRCGYDDSHYNYNGIMFSSSHNTISRNTASYNRCSGISREYPSPIWSISENGCIT